MVEEVETSSIMEESIRVQPSDNEDLEDGEIVDHDDSSSSKPRLPAEVHPLEHKWTFWFDIPSAKSKHIDWGSNLRRIHTFSTAEEFWGLYNNINHPSKLCGGADLYCFKSDIEPKWEDPICADGGKWTVNFNQRGKSDIHWLYTLLGMIGEQFDHGDKICGAVVNIKAKQEKISLWTKTATNETAQISIGKQWKEFLDCNDTIGFIVHNDALNKITKNRYTV